MDAGAVRQFFDAPLAPLSRAERITVWLLTIVIAITRWPALSQTLWDWDEALFALATRDYDVRFYHPHPPGFPLFIGLAKLIPHHDAFHALQAIVFVSSLLVFPAAFLLARSLRAPVFVAIATGVLLAFFPNVWFYGGTALSDVPSMVLSLFACALLLRGRAIPGALVLGIAAGIRPQNLLIAAVPLLIVFLLRRRAAIIGIVLVILIVAASYGVAAAESGGWAAWRETLAGHERYIRETDSFLSPIRPSLLRVADDFFVRPYRAVSINAIVTALVLIALWRRRPHVLAAIAVFGPFCLFAWLYLDFHSVSRFSIAYMPLFALLAADGLEVARKARPAVLVAIAATMIVWTWPALRIVHRTASPPVAAIDWIRTHVPREDSIVYVDERVAAHAALLLDGYEQRRAVPPPVATMHGRARVVLLQEGPGRVSFRRDPSRLANIARPRYFEASVTPLQRIAFADGWYGEEGLPLEPWRWMGRRSRTILPRGSRVSLRIAVPTGAVVQIYLDGKLLERIEAKQGILERTFDSGSARELVFETSAVVHAPGDSRDLGLRLESLLITA